MRVARRLFQQFRYNAMPAYSAASAAARTRARGVGETLARVFAGGGERRARLHTLTLIRWIAVVGQAFTILFVHISLGISLPLVPLLAAVLLSALVNLPLTFLTAPSTRVNERSAGTLLAYDILQLAFLLALTGGLQNPFSVLLLVPITISATILSLRMTVMLCALVILTLSLLGIAPTQLPWQTDHLMLPGLYMLASWIALVLATMLIAGYAWRVADEARRISDALAATHMALAREQQLSALGGLAAAAAHELGSPLATIAVTSREIANSLPTDSPVAEEVALLVSQSQRCREILYSLGQRTEDSGHAPFDRVPLAHLLDEIVRPYREPTVRLAIATHRTSGEDQPDPLVVPTPELKHGLITLIENALEFAKSRVDLRVILRGERIELCIEDDGPGFSDEVLERLGEPYISTRREHGGLGLGVFIAQTLLARTGATLQFGNTGRGARVTVRWDRSRLERTAAGEQRHEFRAGAERG
jgi:two-component system, sensor histidine kinase RegB